MTLPARLAAVAFPSAGAHTLCGIALFIDVHALATVLSSRAWPAARCEEALTRYFSKDQEHQAEDADRDDYRSILDAARAEQPDDLPARMDQICALMPWNDVKDGRDAKLSTYILKQIGAYSYNISARREVATGRWLRTNPLDIVCLLQALDVPAAERGAWAARLVRAIEWGEPAAMEAVRERVKQVSLEAWHSPVWDAADDIEARTFDLITSGLASSEERALWPLSVSAYASSAARACVRFFETVGLPRPSPSPPAGAEHSEQDWAEYALFVKIHFPARLDEAIVKLFEKVRLYPRILRALCGAAADAKSTAGEKTTWEIGQHEVSHTGNPTAGRWTLRRTTPTAPLRLKLAARTKIAPPPAGKTKKARPKAKKKAGAKVV